MVNRSYLNTINPTEVSIAIEHLIIAPYLTAWTPQRIDLGNLAGTAPGFADLGAVVEDSTSLKAVRSKFQLETGIPQVLQFESVMKMTGELTAHLHSNSWRKIQYALGNYTAVSSATAVTTTKVQNLMGDVTITLASSGGNVASICVGGQYTLSGSLGNADAADAFEFRVTAITSNTSLAVLSLSAGVPNSLAIGATISQYSYVQQPIGGRTILYYYILGLADFIDGSQVVHECLKCSSNDDFTETIHPNMNERIPLGFKLLGIPAVIGGCADLIVANRYYFPHACGSC